MDKEQQLIDRLNRNLLDYHDHLIGFNKRELIDMAGMISAVNDSHFYLTECHVFEPQEIDYLLNFESPLEVVSDEWALHQEDISDFSFVLDKVFEQQEALKGGYVLTKEPMLPEDMGPHRYMDVDLIDFLGKISDKVILYYPNDWNIDKDTLRDAAASNNPEEKHLMWHVCSCGTHIQLEHGVFIRDSGPYGYWTDYRQNDPDMFGYALEITGSDGQTVRGNVFSLGNYAEHANYVRDTALPKVSVTLTYSDDWGVNAGKTITVSRREYDDDRHRLMSESGNVVSLHANPASEAELSTLLARERSQRMSYPLGNCEAHLRNLTARLDELRPPTERPETEKKPIGIADRLRAAQERVDAQPVQSSGQKNKQISIE